MNRPCKTAAICVPCADDQAPIQNLSAEDADPVLFLSVGYGRFIPGLDELWNALGCVTWCFSGFSQQDADLCAQRQADLCAGNRFLSQAQICHFTCADGSVSIFAIPAGLFAGATQAEADAKAHSFTCSAAALLCEIPVPARFYNAFQHCEATCADGSIATYDFPAGLIFAGSQEAADAQAMALACQLAALSCPPGTGKFWNTEQTCEQTCSDGTVATMITPPHTFFGPTQEEADDIAKAYACSLVRLQCSGQPVFNQAQTCQIVCPNGAIHTATVPAGLWIGFDQASANALAMQAACDIATGNCSGVVPFADPVSCTVACFDGSPFTYTLPGGMLFANATEALRYACQTARWHRLCLGELDSPTCVSVAYTGIIEAAGKSLAQFPLTDFWEITAGALPPGLVFNGGFITGGIATITGTPTTVGSYDFTVKITNNFGDFMEKDYTLVIAGITNSSPLPAGSVGSPYSVQLTTSGFVLPRFTLSAGALPDGLSLSPSGLISGTPTSNQIANFTIDAEESP